MRLLSKTLPSNHELILLGDTHYGTVLRHEDGIREALEYISGKNRWACFMGDAVEAITIDDVRFDSDTVDDPIPLRQAKKVIRDFAPFKNKFLVWLLGNHEVKLQKFGNLALLMADEIGVPYGTYSSVLSISDSHGVMYRIYLAHGWGSINSSLNQPDERHHSDKRSLKRKLFPKVAHCGVMAMGHTHKLLVKPPSHELYLSGEDHLKQHYTKHNYTQDYIHPDLRWYVNTGSFYKLYGEGAGSGYAERAGFNPNILGFPIIKVVDREIVDIELKIL